MLYLSKGGISLLKSIKFGRSNPTEAEILVYEDSEIILHSHFNINKTTVFLIHGWLGSGDNEMNQLLTEGKKLIRFFCRVQIKTKNQLYYYFCDAFK